MNSESTYMTERAGQLSTAVGMARLALSQGDPARAARRLDECCDELHELHWQACLDDGHDPEAIERFIGPRGEKVRNSWPSESSGLADDRRQLAQDLLEIAELAMPDTYFQTDSRCQRARLILGIT